MSARGGCDPLAGWAAERAYRLDTAAYRSRLAGLIMCVLSLATVAAVLAGCRP